MDDKTRLFCNSDSSKESGTVFPYKCECSYRGRLAFSNDAAVCPDCSRQYPIVDGTIAFTRQSSVQTEIYDAVYSSGYHSLSQMKVSEVEFAENTSTVLPFESYTPLAEIYLGHMGYSLENGLENLSILDAACGSGAITATILNHSRVENCKVHAFDISSYGVAKLQQHVKARQHSNSWEFSIQNALQMHFVENTFDAIIGSSILHHFDDYTAFLDQCFRVLKPGGKLALGEPFAIGYGMAYAVMKIVANEMSIHIPLLDAMYNDVAVRIKNLQNPEFLQKLVDKHLFFGDELSRIGKEIGYATLAIIPAKNLQEIRRDLMDVLCDEVGAADQTFRHKCKSYYEVLTDVFGAESTFHKTVSTFNYLVFTKPRVE